LSLTIADQCTGCIADFGRCGAFQCAAGAGGAADIDVHEQIKSVLAVLDHKLKSVHVTQHFAADCGPRARLSER
jgi:carbamate kinase